MLRTGPGLEIDIVDNSESLIVIGSSAGGIEALCILVSSLPADFPAPIVIAQHVDPTKPSHLSEILARRTKLAVHAVAAEAKLKPGVIYVVPSDNHIELTDHSIKPLKDPTSRPVPSINFLFNSAALAFKENLIAVILTGMGSDGAIGAKQVHTAGGTVVIQNPETADFPDMPSSLDPTIVDIVEDIERIGQVLNNLVSGRKEWQGVPQADLSLILAEIQNRSGIDFTQYKPATIHRRLERRIVSTHSANLQAYSKYLEKHPEEYQKLINAFLIKVTEFSRDPALFDYLKSDLFPKLIQHAQDNRHSIRVWSAGCATGEEAYTLAILFLEALGANPENIAVRIFATDLDSKAVAFARRGTYLPRSLQNLKPEWIERYFEPLDELYQIKRQVRELVVFGEHDLGQRAPFPNLDLILCRNVMIYFSLELQRRALQLFAFSLRVDGYLVLGKAETTTPFPNFFNVVHAPNKTYQRSSELMAPPPVNISPKKVSNPITYYTGLAKTKEHFSRAQVDLQQARASMDSLLKNLPIGVVLIDNQYHILEINATARKFLRIFSPALGEDLIHATDLLPGRELRNGIDTAFKNAAPVVLKNMMLPGNSSSKEMWIHISCYPHDKNAASLRTESVMILIHDVTSLLQQQEELRAAQENQKRQLDDLQLIVKELQTENAAQINTIKSLSKEPEEADAASKTADGSSGAVRQSYAELKAAYSVLLAKTGELELNQSKANAEVQETRKSIAQQKTLLNEVLDGNEQLMRTNEDLRHANEELMLTAEEAEAMREEAETLTEEVQAGNEELETLNEELQASVEELNTTNADLSARTIELEAMSLRTEQERGKVAAVLQSLKECVVVVNLEGKIVLSNRSYDEIFGSAPILQDENGGTLDPRQLPLARAAGGESFQGCVSTPTNPRRYFEVIGTRVKDNIDKSLHSVLTFVDITSRRQMEQSNRDLERKARVDAEKANQEKDEFLAVLSRELGTPLTSMYNWVKIIQKGKIDDPNLKKGLQVIERNIQVQTRLTEGLLDISRIVTGKLSIERKPVEFNKIVEQSVEMLRYQAEEKTIKIHFERNDERVSVMGDEPRLRHAVSNVLLNAIKFTSNNGSIRIRLERSEKIIVLSIEDNGQGIHADFLPHIFKRFTPEDVGFTPRNTGMGLSISRTIIDLHEGSIAAFSEGEGKGATFKISLPVIDVIVEPSSASSKSIPATLKSVRILIVEDDADVRQSLLHVFQSQGAQVATADCKQRALIAVDEFKPHLIVSDIGLPGGDGIELIREIRHFEKENRAKHIPAIAVTGYVKPQDQERTKNAGFQLHIGKPFDPDELVAAVNNLLKH